jgi:hypothetical protein
MIPIAVRAVDGLAGWRNEGWFEFFTALGAVYGWGFLHLGVAKL